MDQGIQVITLVTTQTIELCSGSNHIQATNVRLKVRQPKEQVLEQDPIRILDLQEVRKKINTCQHLTNLHTKGRAILQQEFLRLDHLDMECHNQSQTGFLQVGQCRRPIKSVLTDYTKMCPLEFTKFNKTPHLTLVRFQKELHKWACLGWKLEVEVCQRTLTRAKIERLCKKEGALLHLSKLKNVPSQRKQGKTYLGQDFKRRKFHLKRVSLRQGP